MVKKILFLFLFFSFFLGKTSAQNCQAYFSYSQTGNSIQFFDSSQINSGNPFYYWTFGDGDSSTTSNPTHTYNQPGTYTVCLNLITSTGCTSTYCDTVAISQINCSADFTYFRVSGNQVAFTNISQATATQSYSWDFGDNATSSQFSPNHTYANAGLYIVRLTANLGPGSSCFKSDTVHVNACSASFVSVQGANGDYNFINSSIASKQTYYSWQFGDGSATVYTKNASHTYQNAGNYVVSLFLYDSLDNCSSTILDSIYSPGVLQCRAGFTKNINQGAVTFQSTATNFTQMTYDFGDGTSSNLINPVHNYQQSGSYVVCQTISDSSGTCTDVFCDTLQITVPPPCAAGFNYNANFGVVSISNTAQNYTNLMYDFGDGTSSSNPNPIHTYLQSGTYIICQTVNNATGCSDSFCDTLVIFIPPPCKADFAYSSSVDSLFIQDLSLQSDSIVYDFGDGNQSMDSNPIHIYDSSGIYLVCQTVYNSFGCQDSYCDTIQIQITPPCMAGFQYSHQRDSTFFQNQASNYTSLLYDFGDGNTSTLTNPVHVYASSGTYLVKQTVFNANTNCSSLFVDTIQINISTSCVSKFEIALDTNQLGTLYLVNTSSNDPSHAYYWTFGDGTSSTLRLPTHRYQNFGPHEVCLTVTDSLMNCSSVYCDTIGLDSNGNLVKSAGYLMKVLEGDFIGIDESSDGEKIELFPNPFQDEIQVLGLTGADWKYTVYSMKGQEIWSGKVSGHKIKLRGHPPGLYLLRLSNGKTIKQQKIIKQ